jgi:hypothetical protein
MDPDPGGPKTYPEDPDLDPEDPDLDPDLQHCTQ